MKAQIVAPRAIWAAFIADRNNICNPIYIVLRLPTVSVLGQRIVRYPLPTLSHFGAR
jgi:hypothetical protein